ncbi:MAG: glycogen/starch synthase [Gemmatimonadota bacterium]|nr:glycogen synthase [Gemmatimonadota bacterium]
MVTTVRSKAAPPAAPAMKGVPPLGAGIVHLVGEYWPYARTGGLAEAVRGLAEHQAASDTPTWVFLPLYRSVQQTGVQLEPFGDPFDVPLGPRTEEARLWKAPSTPGHPTVVFVSHPHYFDRPGLYGEDGDYPDNHRRFAFFVKAALLSIPRLGDRRWVVNAHDWHTALAPVLLRTELAGQPVFDAMATVLSVHNAGYQGHFAPETLVDLGLPLDLFHWARMEWYGRVNWLKGGLVYADFAATVSPTHAYELRTPTGGFGLHDQFIALGDRLVGILNGIDLSIWDPEHDPVLPGRFTKDALEGKALCKADLQRAAGLPEEPRKLLVGMTARLAQQKGFDILLGDGLLYRIDAQFVFVGEGEARYRNALAEVAANIPDRVAVRFVFTEEREHRLLAGADALLMPSLYEPCGLTQMRAQRYGALPIVRRVGGLSDTVEDQVTGFVFDEYSPAGLERAIRRALATYQDERAWNNHMREAMSRDFGWGRSAIRYLDLYRRALAAHARAS